MNRETYFKLIMPGSKFLTFFAACYNIYRDLHLLTINIPRPKPILGFTQHFYMIEQQNTSSKFIGEKFNSYINRTSLILCLLGARVLEQSVQIFINNIFSPLFETFYH